MSHSNRFARWLALSKRSQRLSVAIHASLIFAALGPATLLAQENPPHRADDQEKDLEKVIVTASPLETDALEMTQSAKVLAGEELRKELANSIGETVSKTLGVQSSSFGPAVGRPVIRGLDGSRVGVLENNVSSNDASNVSADHAVSIEPFLADQVEVLRGPATLLYGSDTIGGVVNVRTNRIPVKLRKEAEGALQVQGDSASDERFGAFKGDFAIGNIAIHGDVFYRDTDDYEIPGFAEADHDDEAHEEGEHEGEEEAFGVLPNSAVQNQGAGLGFAYFGSDWRGGLSFSNYQTDYGIPGGHAHEEGEEEDHDGEDHGEEEELVSIDLESDTIAGELEFFEPFSGVEKIKLLGTYTDYQHVELEGSEIGTQFNGETLENRLEVTHTPIGAWRGVVGLQYADRDFQAIGDEAFVPPTTTDNIAIFLLEEARYGDWRLEFGARLEDQDVTTDDGRRSSHSPVSLSAGTVYHIDQTQHLNFNLSRAQRAPAEEELFAFGPHIATQTFEVGNAELDEETATNIELSYQKHFGVVTGTLTLFRTDFDDFIYLGDTGMVEDDLPVREWRQQDADFQGVEAEVVLHVGSYETGDWHIRLFGDTVDAELADGSSIPRQPTTRFGTGLDWESERLFASMDWTYYAAQRDVAEFETDTDSYSLLNADVSWRLPIQGDLDWEIYLRGRNLTDEEARPATSFLKDVAPLPGRNWVMGIRAEF